MKVHHFGFLTRNIEKSINEFNLLGFVELKRIIDTERKVAISLIKSESNEIFELIEPISGNSIVSNIIEKYNNSIYHVCYLTKDINSTIELLKQNGYILINPPKNAILFDNKKVAFMYSKYAGMIELIEED